MSLSYHKVFESQEVALDNFVLKKSFSGTNLKHIMNPKRFLLFCRTILLFLKITKYGTHVR